MSSVIGTIGSVASGAAPVYHAMSRPYTSGAVTSVSRAFARLAMATARSRAWFDRSEPSSGRMIVGCAGVMLVLLGKMPGVCTVST
ncbi:hypothetical protein DCC79_01035 [bacterium]|nr:MAG: hypothetical protein DCC79_01035 [bacterium]